MSSIAAKAAFLAASFFVSLLPASALAQQLPPACLTKDEEQPPPGGLPAAPPVVFDKLQIIHLQKPYYVNIFSDTAQKPGSRFDQCFRYEAENEGPPVVNSFYWELANGMWVDPMVKEERHSRRVVRPVDNYPQVIKTTAYAFAKDPGEGQAWAAVPRPKGGGASPDPAANFATVMPDSIAGLSKFLQAHDLPPRPLTAFYLKESGSKASTLEDVYSGPRIKIALRSDASREGDQISVRTEVIASGEASTEARYFMPALRALQPLEKPADVEVYERFFNRYSEFHREGSRYQPIWVFPLSMAASAAGDGTVYRILHPIGIEYKGEHICILAASYAPLPVSFRGDDCPSWFAAAPR
jgi:hypothetical protein